MEIEGITYSEQMVQAFLKVKGKKDVLDLPRRWLEQHLISFKEGYDLGCKNTEADAPDCDVCERINPEDGPPANHPSQVDR